MLGIEVFLPLSTFTFRPYEALLYTHSGIGMPFYPDNRLRMNSVGDLCSGTRNSIKKDELWITDALGFRNDQLITDPDVVLIGDSFVLGSGLTQDSTITNLLTKKFNNTLKFYNLAPASLAEFNALYQNKTLRKPSLMIFSMGEIDEFAVNYDKTRNYKLYKNTKISELKNKATRLYSINFIMSRIFNRRVHGIPGDTNSKMFFLSGKNLYSNLVEIKMAVETIQVYKDYCDSLGIDFIFLPIPSKESVYYEDVTLSQQPDYIFNLIKELKSRNITAINSLEVFNEFRKENNKLLYHIDDTHWNSLGINLIANKVVEEIESNPQYAVISKN